jgi:hypothetical protein
MVFPSSPLAVTLYSQFCKPSSSPGIGRQVSLTLFAHVSMWINCSGYHGLPPLQSRVVIYRSFFIILLQKWPFLLLHNIVLYTTNIPGFHNLVHTFPFDN